MVVEPVEGGPGDGTTQRLRALTDFAKALSAARWSDDVLTMVATEAMGALEADSVSLSAWERESGWLRTLVNVGLLGPHEEARPTTEIYPIAHHQQFWDRFEQGRGFVAQATHDGPPANIVDRLLRETDKTSGLAVPVLVDGRLWGELWASRTAGRPPFTESDLDFAGAVAVQVAAGVGQAEHLARVERMAYSDPLTGLANRRVLEDHLDQAMARHAADGVPVTLAAVDLNDLKRINDQQGHEAGDVALRALAHLLSAAASRLPGSVAARLGGDEFCLLAVDVPAEQAVDVVRDFAAATRRALPDGISVGIASTAYLNDRVESGAGLLRVADAAQYRAKRAKLADPVVAGLPTADPSDPPPTARPARRRWRDLTVDPGQVLRAAAAVLDGLPDADVPTRVAAVVAEVCRLGDGSSWWLSMLPAGDDRFYTVDSGVSRVPVSYREDFRAFYDDDRGYAVADYPQSLRAVQGVEVVVEGDDPDADPAESALLALGGFSEMVMVGGRDQAGNGWLAEVFADAISASVRDYALAMRAAVAMAITGAGVPPPAQGGRGAG